MYDLLVILLVILYIEYILSILIFQNTTFNLKTKKGIAALICFIDSYKPETLKRR